MMRQRGFTLLELLIGLVLISFLLALLFAGFRLASDSWDAADRRTIRTTDEEMARTMVRRLTSQLQPKRWKKALNQPIAFIGEAGGYQGIAPLPGQAGGGGLQVVAISAERDADNKHVQLVLRHAPISYDQEYFASGIEAAKPHKLLGELTTVEFSYFGSAKQGEPGQWFDTWPNPDRLPQLMRIRLGTEDSGWSDLMVTPMITGNNCRWNDFYKKCMFN